MDYFAAIQEGKRRVAEAVAMLQEAAGPCYPMLLLKLGVTPWAPVGEEMLQKLVPGKGGTAAIVICDAEGNSKAMSTWVPRREAEEGSKKLERKGVPLFSGEVKLPL